MNYDVSRGRFTIDDEVTKPRKPRKPRNNQPTNTTNTNTTKQITKENNNMKKYIFGVIFAVAAIFGLVLFEKTLHKNDIQNIQVRQTIFGNVDVNRTCGYYTMFFPSVWTYPRAGVYVLNDKDKDALIVKFNNKSTAKVYCQIGYRIDEATDEQIIRLHQEIEGDEEKIWDMVLKEVNTASQVVASKYDPSSVIGGTMFEEFKNNLVKSIVHSPELLAKGIDITRLAIDGSPKPDELTEKQFEQQKQADLAKRLAEAEKVKLEAEAIRVKAQYEKEIEEQAGKAKAQMAKEVQDAERMKKVAEVEAQKKVALESLAKEQLLIQMNKEKEAAAIEAEKKVVLAEIQKREMLVQAAKEREVAEIAAAKEAEVAQITADKERKVAEIAKATEAERLEQVRLQSEQVIAKANAKKEAIALAGEITEQERVRLEIEKETKIGVAKAYADGIGKLKLPTIMQNGGSTNGGSGNGLTDAIGTFLQVKNATAALELQNAVNTTEAPTPEVK